MTEPWLYALLGALLALIAVGALVLFVNALRGHIDAMDDIDWENHL